MVQLRDMELANYTYEVESNDFKAVWIGKALLAYFTVNDPGAGWVISLYDAADIAHADETTEIGTWVTASGGGTYEIFAVCTNGIVFKSSTPAGGNPGDATIAYTPKT